MSKMFPDKKKYAVVFYFDSPIMLYAVYMHGQLDIIPIVLLLCSIYYLASKDQYRYAVGCSVDLHAANEASYTGSSSNYIFVFV